LILGVGQKQIFSIDSTFNEVFQQYYLQLFAQLLAAIASPPVGIAPLNNAAQTALIAGDPATAAVIAAGGM
jgi:hypothetical protein